MMGMALPVFSCLDGTSIKVRTAQGVKVLSQLSLVQEGETSEVVEVRLGSTFEIVGQNSMEMALLTVEIFDSGGSKVFEDKASQGGLIRVKN